MLPGELEVVGEGPKPWAWSWQGELLERTWMCLRGEKLKTILVCSLKPLVKACCFTLSP